MVASVQGSHLFIMATPLGRNCLKPYTLYSTCMSSENTHKLMGLYMEV